MSWFSNGINNMFDNMFNNVLNNVWHQTTGTDATSFNIFVYETIALLPQT